MKNAVSVACGVVALVGCGEAEPPDVAGDGVLLVALDDDDALRARILETNATYLEQLTGTAPRIVRIAADEGYDAVVDAAKKEAAGLVVVFDAPELAGESWDDDRIAGLGEWGFALDVEEEVGSWHNRLGDRGATFVWAAATSPLSRQYAGYEVLRRLGARFFHPEQEYVPQVELDSLRARAQTPTALHRAGSDYVPEFDRRSWSFHGSHPLEHLEAFSDGDFAIDEAVHVNDWVVKNFGNEFKGAGRGIASEESRARRVAELEELRTLLGFPRGAGITLHNEQQGATAEIDPESSVPVQTQIETLVRDKLAATPDARTFGIHFGPTEFTVTPDEQTVQWIDWAGQAALEAAPGIRVEINNHITGTQPSPNFDDLGCANGTNDDGRIDYYDLAFHTDPRLGVKVHTVMFYPLEGEARVYNQQTFSHKLCLMQLASAQGRPLGWFPEGSWWLSFDNPIPVYLPLHILTRARDIDLVAPLLTGRGGTLDQHRMFNSGQEWGYWQQDYAVGLKAFNTEITTAQILGEMFDPLCAPAQWPDGCDAKTEAVTVLTEVMEHQRQMFLERTDVLGRPGGLYAYFAGEDQADEIAAVSGFEFRPVRVSFTQVAGWEAAELDAFEAGDLAALSEAAAAYTGWRDRLEAVRADVPEAGQPWLSEVVDGIAINGLRAEQTRLLYDAIVAMRRAELAGDTNPAAAGEASYGAAAAVLGAAETIIRGREAGYRYPAAQTHGGGLTPETAVPNGTTYPFRVHTKTHLMTYWHNRDGQVRALLDGETLGMAQSVVMTDAIAAPGEDLSVVWPSLSGLGGEVTVAGSTIEPPTETLTLPNEAGYWPVDGSLVAEGRELEVTGGVARTAALSRTPAAGLTLIEPSDPLAQGVLGSVFPALEWGYVADGDTLVLAADPEDDGVVAHGDVAAATATLDGGGAFTTTQVALSIPIAMGSGGVPIHVALTDVVMSGTITDGALQSPVRLDGAISVGDLVVALQELAGFDEAGALMTLSGILGFDPANPPETVPVLADVEIAAPV